MKGKDTTPDPGPKSLRDRMQNNVIVLLIVSGVAVAGTTFSISEFLYSQEQKFLHVKQDAEMTALKAKHQEELFSLLRSHDSDRKEFEDRITSIEREIGENHYFDIRNFFIQDSKTAEVSKRAQYFSDANFYAPRDRSRWTYAEMTTMDFLRYMLGDDNPILSMIRIPPEAEKFERVSIWMGQQQQSLEGGPYKRLMPYVFVERLSHQEYYNMLNKTVRAHMAKLQANSDQDVSEEVVAEGIELLMKSYRDDVVTTTITGGLNFMSWFKLHFPNTRVYVKKLQKIDNVLYMQNFITMSNVKVDGVPHDQYYITLESFFISTPKELYVVATFVPSSEPVPRHEYFVWVNEWLGDFRVVIRQ